MSTRPGSPGVIPGLEPGVHFVHHFICQVFNKKNETAKLRTDFVLIRVILIKYNATLLKCIRATESKVDLCFIKASFSLFLQKYA